MARANLGSRRACEEIIEQRRVRVNGVIAQLGDKADPQTDVIEVDGHRLSFKEQRKIYIALHKPINVLTTNLGNRQDKRPTVRSLVPIEGHLFSIGRLDAESEGLVVLTNDGELVQRLTHPKFKHTKTYKVYVHGLPPLEVLERWREGITLQDEDGTSYKTAPCSVEIVKGDREITTLRVVMTEGRKRQIRRIAAALGHPVHRLLRTQIGKLEIGTLRPGEWRELDARDVQALSTPSDELRTILERRPRRARPAHSGETRAEGDRSRRAPREAGASERPARKPLRGQGKARRAPADVSDSDKRPAKPRRPRPAASGDSSRPERPKRAPRNPAAGKARRSDKPARPASGKPPRRKPRP